MKLSPVRLHGPVPLSSELGEFGYRSSLTRSGTYQSYLTRQPSFLRACLAHAEENGYALGLKVVRGGYIVQERRKARLPGREGEDPVWPT